MVPRERRSTNKEATENVLAALRVKMAIYCPLDVCSAGDHGHSVNKHEIGLWLTLFLKVMKIL